MKHGFLKVALCRPPIVLGAPMLNLAEIKRSVLAAAKQKCELAVFGQMALTGTTLGSMACYDQLHKSVGQSIEELLSFSKSVATVIVVGLPIRANSLTESAAAIIHNGKIEKIILKDIENATVVINNVAYDAVRDCVVTLPCFNASFSIVFGEDFDLYEPRANAAVKNGAQLILNLASGKALIDSFDLRLEKIALASKRLGCAYVYVSTGFGESVAKNVYCGDKICGEMGKILIKCEGLNPLDSYAEIDIDSLIKARQLSQIETASVFFTAVVDCKNQNADITRSIENLPFVPSATEFSRILEIMGRAIYSRLCETKMKKVIFGLSGGLDSAMVLIACEKMFRHFKLDLKDIICVTMNAKSSSSRTKQNALRLVKTFGVGHIDVPIEKAVDDHLAAIGHSGIKDIVYENAQARERAQILLDLSNKHNALMLGTGDLSEIALGWSTYGGDQLAQYNPNSSLTKTLIRAIMRNYCLTSSNSEAALIINDVLATPVSPELLPGQETEKLLGPYELHDFFLYNLIGKGFGVEKVVYLTQKAFPEAHTADILKTLRIFITRFFTNQFKRNAGCDGVQVTEFDLADKIIYSEFDDETYLNELERVEKELLKVVSSK